MIKWVSMICFLRSVLEEKVNILFWFLQLISFLLLNVRQTPLSMCKSVKFAKNERDFSFESGF